MPSVDAKTSADIYIRQALENDADSIAGLLEELGYPGEISFARDHIRRSRGPHSHSDIQVVECNKAIVGFIAWYRMDVLPYPYAWLRITALCVTASHRHKGLGHALEASAQRAAVRQGCEFIELTSDILRTTAHRFYERLGYVEKRRRYMKRISMDHGKRR